ncbi:MAG: hypothetical protein O2794_00120 [bacterium]|nr:hypothetical protein [bacterium]
MKIKGLKFITKYIKKPGSEAIIPFADFIWQATIITLIVGVTALIAYDAYVFIFRVQVLEKINIEIIPGGGVQEVNDKLLKQAVDIFEERERVSRPVFVPLPVAEEEEE